MSLCCSDVSAVAFLCGVPKLRNEVLWDMRGSRGESPSLMAIKVLAETGYIAVDLCEWPKAGM